MNVVYLFLEALGGLSDKLAFDLIRPQLDYIHRGEYGALHLALKRGMFQKIKQGLCPIIAANMRPNFHRLPARRRYVRPHDRGEPQKSARKKLALVAPPDAQPKTLGSFSNVVTVFHK